MIEDHIDKLAVVRVARIDVVPRLVLAGAFALMLSGPLLLFWGAEFHESRGNPGPTPGNVRNSAVQSDLFLMNTDKSAGFTVNRRPCIHMLYCTISLVERRQTLIILDVAVLSL